MAESLTISKSKSVFPAYLNYAEMRKTGIGRLEELASEIWTDFNAHDPGITILEVLCYALTDLGYRLRFDEKDLFAPGANGAGNQEDNFFTPAQILGCNPTTVTDFRKVLMDVPGVRNAWLEKAETSEVELFVDVLESKLKYEPGDSAIPLKLNGLYEILLDMERPSAVDACGREQLAQEEIIDEVQRVLHRYRNLCEDYFSVRVLEEEEIGICADIEIAKDADPETVLTGIYLGIQNFLVPQIRFYTLPQLLEKGKPIEAIFAGRPHSDQSHGFIDTEELEKSPDQLACIRISDIYQILLDVPGVLAIKKLELVNYINGLPQTTGETWNLPLTSYFRPVLSIHRSKITFFKGLLPFVANEQEVRESYEEQLATTNKAFLSGYQLDLPVPKGPYRDFADYSSIQHEFPLLYGIGEAGLSDQQPTQRHAQAKQLKAYLLFFDQLLANYLMQLAHVRDLFSFADDDDRENTGSQFGFMVIDEYSEPLALHGASYENPEERNQAIQNLTDQLAGGGLQVEVGSHRPYAFVLKDLADTEVLHSHKEYETLFDAQEAGEKCLLLMQEKDFIHLTSDDRNRSYFTQALDDVPRVAELLRGYVPDGSGTSTVSNPYLDELNYIVEDEAQYFERRNRFLDHLLARFAEQFTDYVLLMYRLGGKKQNEAQLISDKTDFLQHYPEISQDRGKAFNYADAEEIWNTHNVSGLQKRVSKLLGIDDFSRRYLYAAAVVEDGGDFYFQVLSEPAADGTRTPLLKSQQGYDTPEAAWDACNRALELAQESDNFLRIDESGNPLDGSFVLMDRDDELAEPVAFDPATQDRETAILEIIRSAGQEGFHLVEHLLLLPLSKGDSLLPVQIEPENWGDLPESIQLNHIDPYSFRATVVLPYWPERFLDMNYRRFFEVTLRKEAPAHVVLKICWIDARQMQEFEALYHAWLQHLTGKAAGLQPCNLTNARQEFVDFLSRLRSVYPEANLHDCVEDEDGRPIILNQTILGTAKDADDE